MVPRVLMFLSLWLPLFAWAETRVVDDAGQELLLEQPARRIVSLAPHLTELLFAAGAGSHVVGAVEFSDYPPSAEALPRVGGYENLDLERILALRPELVVAWQSGNPPAQVEQLRRLGLPVYLSEPRRLEQIPLTLERLGRLAGSEPMAERAAADFRRELLRLRQTYQDRRTVSVFYQVWHRPLMTIGGEHLINDLIGLCGGGNVFAGLSTLAPQVDVEAVLAADPEAIIASGMDASRPQWLEQWRRWPRLRAVAAGHLYHIPPDLLQRNGPRILEGADRLCRALERVRAGP